MKYRIHLLLPVLGMLNACNINSPALNDNVTAAISESPVASTASAGNHPLNAHKILAQKQVPILCYHRIRSWKTTDTKSMKDYIVPVETFKEEMKMLADSGYKTILPD